MIASIATAFAAARRARGWLTLLAVAGAAAWLYFQFESVRADRDRLAAWGRTVCASADAQLAPAGARRGEACATAIARLARLKDQALAETSRVLLDAARERETKSAADVAAARAAAERARDANHRMEAANAAIGEDDRIGADWLGAFNRLAGLRHDPAR